MSAGETTTQQDAIEVLTADHQEVEAMFGQLEALPEGPERDQLVQQVTRELSVHAAVEEQVLYPAMRRSLADGESQVEEALDEHQAVKETLVDIERASDPDERDELLEELIGDVRHHVEEEEGELFPELRAAIGQDELRQMGSALQAAKKMAPTHPHPHAPSTPPGNIVGGVAAAAADKIRDAVQR